MVELIDVTLRESVYYGDGLTYEDGLDYLRSVIAKVPCEYVQWNEIGYLNTNCLGELNYDPDYINQAYEICNGHCKLVAMMHPSKSDVSKWDPDVVRKIALARVTVSAVTDDLKLWVDYFHNLGVLASCNIMYSSNLSHELLSKYLDKVKEIGFDYAYFADSSGSYNVNNVSRLVHIMQEHCGSLNLGLHLHDHMQMALANAITAVNSGIRITDVSVTGAGKGGGNLKMEQALMVFMGYENITAEIVGNIYDHVVWFNKLIHREQARYDQEMIGFMTGVYGLNLTKLANLQMNAGGDVRKYLMLASEEQQNINWPRSTRN